MVSCAGWRSNEKINVIKRAPREPRTGTAGQKRARILPKALTENYANTGQNYYVWHLRKDYKAAAIKFFAPH